MKDEELKAWKEFVPQFGVPKGEQFGNRTLYWEPCTPAIGSISGATPGSHIAAGGVTGFTVNSAARTWAWDGTGLGGTLTLVETLPSAENSPLVHQLKVTLNGARQAIRWPRRVFYDHGDFEGYRTAGEVGARHSGGGHDQGQHRLRALRLR